MKWPSMPGAPGSGSPWKKWGDPSAPEPAVTAGDVEGYSPSSSAPSPSSVVRPAASTSTRSLEDLVDEFLASRGGGSTAPAAAPASAPAAASSGASSSPSNYYIYPRPRRPRYLDVEIEGASGKDIGKILKQIRKMNRDRDPYDYPPSRYGRMIPVSVVPGRAAAAPAATADSAATAAPAAAASATPNGDPASLLKDFLAYAKSKNMDLSGVPASTIASALDTDSKDDGKKEYSEADLEKKKREIDEAVEAGKSLEKKYGDALDAEMRKHETNRKRWNRYRHWSPAIAAASTIGGGVLADKLYSKYVLGDKDPAIQTNGEWWQRFLAARAGNLGGFLLSQIPNRLILKPRKDMSTQPYPIPSEIK